MFGGVSMTEVQPLIVFDDESKTRILSALGLKADAEGNLVDENQKVLINLDFEKIGFEEFGGILIGSKIPIKKESSELIRYFLQ